MGIWGNKDAASREPDQKEPSQEELNDLLVQSVKKLQDEVKTLHEKIEVVKDSVTIHTSKERESQSLEKKDDAGSSAEDEKAPTPVVADVSDLTDVAKELASLREDFQNKLMYDDQKREQINKLHAELQTYKDNLANSLREPMLTDLIMLVTQLDREIKKYEENTDGMNPTAMLENFRSIPEYIDDLLKRQGVEVYSTEPGAEFDAIRHKGKNRIETPDKTKERTVARSLLSGYEFGGKILAKELVDVYVHGSEAGAVNMPSVAQ